MRKQFVKSIQNILYNNPKTALLLGDIGVFGFREELKNLPNRVYNIGILEQAMIGVAAGFSKSGIIPFVHTIAPFMVERSLEQLKIDFGYENLNGNFISVGSSYDYASLGCTHHCPGDVLVLSSIPAMQIIVPGTSKEFDTLINETYNNGSPTYYRLSEYENKESKNVNFGKGIVIKTGSKATIICYGNILESVIDACENLDVTVLYYTTISPFDSNLLLENFNENIIVCEPFYEGSTNYFISQALKNKKYKLNNIGVPRKFLINYGSKKEHDAHLKLDVIGIRERIKECVN